MWPILGAGDFSQDFQDGWSLLMSSNITNGSINPVILPFGERSANLPPDRIFGRSNPVSVQWLAVKAHSAHTVHWNRRCSAKSNHI